MQHKKLYRMCKNPWPDTSGSSAIAFNQTTRETLILVIQYIGINRIDDEFISRYNMSLFIPNI